VSRNLPVKLRRSAWLDVALPCGASARLPVARPSFPSWTGEPVFTYGGKPLLDYDGKVCFAELLILRLLLKSGWSGTWVETFGGVHYLQSMPASWTLARHHIPIPADKHELLRQIAREAKTDSCFDVFVWSGERVLFCEAKGLGDGWTKPQLKFIQGALDCGIAPQALLLVQWSYLETAAHRGGHMVAADNGGEPDQSKPIDQRQVGVQADQSVDTSGNKKARRAAATDQMPVDLRS
jgi:hypothetical protein